LGRRGRVCGEGSAAAGQGFGEQEGRIDGVVGKKGGELGLMGGGVPEQYGGAGLDKIATTVLTRKLSIYGGFAVTHGACGDRNAADRLFRDGRTEEEIFAEAGDGRIDRGLLFVGTASGLGAQNSLTRAELNQKAHTTF